MIDEIPTSTYALCWKSCGAHSLVTTELNTVMFLIKADFHDLPSPLKALNSLLELEKTRLGGGALPADVSFGTAVSWVKITVDENNRFGSFRRFLDEHLAAPSRIVFLSHMPAGFKADPPQIINLMGAKDV